MMMRYGKEDHLGILSIEAPCAGVEGLEALAAELGDLRARIQYDADIRCILLSGLERINIVESSDLLEWVSEAAFGAMEIAAQPAKMIAAVECPTVAAINGPVSGIALELALACDLRIASENASFSLSCLQAGLIPWNGGAQRLSRLVGKAKALEMLLTGCAVDGAEALRLGLVNRLIKEEELQGSSRKLACEIASRGPIALQYTKEAVYKGMDMTLGQGLRLESDLYLLIHTTEDRAEGIRAFQEKRKAEFFGK